MMLCGGQRRLAEGVRLIAWLLTAVLAVIWVLLAVAARSPQLAQAAARPPQRTQAAAAGKPAKAGGFDLNEHVMTLPFMWALESCRGYERMSLWLAGRHQQLLVLYGQGWTLERTKRFVAHAFGSGYGALAGSAAIAAAGEETAILGLGVLLAALLPAVRFHGVTARLEKRRQDIVLALPDMLSKLMLLVGAGETVQSALMRCGDGLRQAGHPLYDEWARAVSAMRNGEPFGKAIEQFNRCCGVREVAVFTTVLLLNYRRGGDQFVLALRELSYTLWEKRKSAARARGEEASSKLLFPLVGIFFVMMVLVAAPAMMLMS